MIAPSILAADCSRLGAEVKAIGAAGADMLHLDVMDGNFVPNISFGADVVATLRPLSDLVFDVHLMIDQPWRYLQTFVDAGADIITVHAEACPHLHRTIQEIKGFDVKAGVALNPATPLSVIEYVAGDLDLLLVMSVNPGFGGQSYLNVATDKLTAAYHLRQRLGLDTLVLEVDGGITVDTAGRAIAAGADILVAGTSVFRAADRAAAIAALKDSGQEREA